MITKVLIEYLYPITFLDSLVLKTALDYRGTGKLRFVHRIFLERNKVLATKGETIVVAYKDSVLLRLPDWMDERIKNFLREFQGGNYEGF